MRWLVLGICLLISAPSYAASNWDWVVTCEVFSDKRQQNVEVFNRTFKNEPGMMSGTSGFFEMGGSFSGVSDARYFSWGSWSCIKMSKDEYNKTKELLK